MRNHGSQWNLADLHSCMSNQMLYWLCLKLLGYYTAHIPGDLVWSSCLVLSSGWKFPSLGRQHSSTPYVNRKPSWKETVPKCCNVYHSLSIRNCCDSISGYFMCGKYSSCHAFQVLQCTTSTIHWLWMLCWHTKICLVVLATFGLESRQAHLSGCYTKTLTSHIQLS